MRVGIIGSGQIARIHGPIILQQPMAEIVGIADPDQVRAKALAAQLHVNSVYTDSQLMIEEQKPDVVHVLTPPEYHTQISIAAMNQGCHVLVEKPMALTVAEAQKMADAARRNGVKLCVDHRMVFQDVIQRAIALTSSGVVGQLVSLDAQYIYDARRNPAMMEKDVQLAHWSYRLNGGPLEDLMPHMAALVLEFIPPIEEFHSVGHSRGILPGGWQDEVRVLFKSGDVTGHIRISLSERPDITLLTIRGTKATLQADLFSNILTVRKNSSLPRALARGLSGFGLGVQYFRGSVGNIFRFARGRIDKSGGIAPIISRFYEAVRNDGEPPIALDKSLAVVDLVSKVWPEPVVGVKKQLSPSVRISSYHHVEPTALVTGASGFIGTHLIRRLLAENITIRTLVRPNSIHAGRLKQLDVDVVEGDLSDAGALHEATRGIKRIYHAGAATNNDWDDHYKSTIKGTEYLINAALANDVERFLHISTLAVYELNGTKKSGIIREDSPYQENPRRMGAYAYSKIEAERLVLDAQRKHGLRATVVRPGLVIGPMGKIFFPHLGYRYQDKLFILLGKGYFVAISSGLGILDPRNRYALIYCVPSKMNIIFDGGKGDRGSTLPPTLPSSILRIQPSAKIDIG